MSVAVAGSRIVAESWISSTSTPPAPTVTACPRCGSDCTPTMSSIAAPSTICLDEEPVAESGHVRDGPPYRGLGVQPHLHTAELGLVREVGGQRLEHDREPDLAGQGRGLSRAARPRETSER